MVVVVAFNGRRELALRIYVHSADVATSAHHGEAAGTRVDRGKARELALTYNTRAGREKSPTLSMAICLLGARCIGGDHESILAVLPSRQLLTDLWRYAAATLQGGGASCTASGPLLPPA
ncbi:hypothetical protein MRX96_012370 [Rhipicephalus microplus]